MATEAPTRQSFNTTRCPHCEEAFRITAIQIAAANGLVRCGRCSRLFQAEPVQHRRSKHHPGSALPPAREALLANIDKAVLLTERTEKLAPGSLARSDWQHTAYNPLEYLDAPPARFTARSLAVTLVLLLLVCAQAGWFYRGLLWNDERVAPYLAAICEVLSCREPAIDYRPPVRTNSLVIRSHALIPNALIARVVLRNTTPDAQPFPALSLTFIGAGNGVIAQRLFQPHEFLSGELKGETRIPPDYDIHVALELVDPGSDANRYQLELVPAS